MELPKPVKGEDHVIKPVWYDKENEIVFTSTYFDAYFYELYHSGYFEQTNFWEKYTIVGYITI